MKGTCIICNDKELEPYDLEVCTNCLDVWEKEHEEMRYQYFNDLF